MDATTILLLPRKLFDKDDNKTASNHSCPWHPSLDQTANKPLFDNVTFHDFNTYFSGACAALSTLIIFVLIFLHGTHFSRPQEQRKVIRIAALVPSYALLCWLSIWSPSASAYLQPWLDVLQAICLATFFLLLNEFVSEGTSEREVFFAALQIPEQKGKRGKVVRFDTSESRLAWYRKKWVFIFQYFVVSVLVAIVSNITEAANVYCEFSSDTGYAHLWLTIIINISVSLAVTSIIFFYVALKKDLAHHRPLLKLLCFKIIVGVAFVVSILFLILNGANALNPTDTITWGDLKSIPNMIECIVMVPISIFFHVAYPWKEYQLGNGHEPLRPTNATVPAANREYQGGLLGWKAYVIAASPMEVLRGLAFSFKMFSEMKKVQDSDAHASTQYEGSPMGQVSPYRDPSPYGYVEQGYPSRPTMYDPVHHGR